MGIHYRCQACGNRTRFDVVSHRRTRAFHHYDLAGDCTVEEEEVLEGAVESVTCRWCASTSAIEVLEDDPEPGPSTATSQRSSS